MEPPRGDQRHAGQSLQARSVRDGPQHPSRTLRAC